MQVAGGPVLAWQKSWWRPVRGPLDLEADRVVHLRVVLTLFRGGNWST